MLVHISRRDKKLDIKRICFRQQIAPPAGSEARLPWFLFVRVPQVAKKTKDPGILKPRCNVLPVLV